MTFWIYVFLFFQTFISLSQVYSHFFVKHREGFCWGCWPLFYEAKDNQFLSPKGHQFDQEMVHSGPIRDKDSQRSRNIIWNTGEDGEGGKDRKEREKKKLKSACKGEFEIARQLFEHA